MKLYGMLDSPFVRRVAISLASQQIDFELIQLSVFSTFNEFSQINPVVKAPTLLLDDGTYLMDSTLILQYIEHQQKLSFFALSAQGYQLLGLILALAEKAVQYVYETQLRAAELQNPTWKQRVLHQAEKACQAIEQQLQGYPFHPEDQVCISLAIVWTFIQKKLTGLIAEVNYPHITQLQQQMEQTEVFQRYAYPQA
ncbi:glutathione S-transferase family protein [Acinetobacter sp. ANC 3791]|uniref:glutathione S-transferase family protein n=1 Tax=Acinetobacter sp. ANC 3791 TaxID=2529836 RepID=UPI00103F7F33|nr:glutathione S-transferase family protein [Acinetobacter sp. ANC 3791]TCB85262.1 glutathione S-transferase family protein [Acinetobacter sp. ANC 3791]